LTEPTKIVAFLNVSLYGVVGGLIWTRGRLGVDEITTASR